MPALHRRNVPNCRPMADGGMRKCSAGACPPQGSGGAWQNPPCQFAVPSHNSGFSHLGVPAVAGMSDWYENRSPLSSFVRKSALQSTSMPALHRRNGPNCRPMVDGGMRKCSAGACPPQGSGGAWQNPPCQFAVPSHNSGFSHLGVPAPAGISDCYESMSWTTIRDRSLRQPLIRHSRHPFVNPAPQSSFRRSKACPVP